jgi:hypothetical protein
LPQCGEEQIEWQEFADAVALFVEVETATHRLSEVMKKDPQFYHIPDFFGDVRSLRATLLVEATSNLSRKTKDGKRELLLSIEYLVSSLSVFNATEPRDTIFGMLAIAKDTSPKAADQDELVSASPAIQQQLRAWGKRNIAIQTYPVDYKCPFIEVFKDFMVFSTRKSDQATALDILCWPWAPIIKDTDDRLVEKLPSWIPALDGAAFCDGRPSACGPEYVSKKRGSPSGIAKYWPKKLSSGRFENGDPFTIEIYEAEGFLQPIRGRLCP